MVRMKDILIADERHLENMKEAFLKGGSKRMHVLTDFDRTLTKAEVNGKPIPSVISILRDKDYISRDYSEKAHALANKYRPIEMNPKAPMSEKKKKMEEWWTQHFNLLIKSGLNIKHLERIVNEGGIQFREGALEFLKILHKERIPLVIISSSGVGDTIPLLLKREKALYDNIHIITNLYEWDKKGNATGVTKPITHVMNKDERSIKDHPAAFKAIKGRTNVMLLGDSIGDLGMLKGSDYRHLIRVGFLNENVEESLKTYRDNFDVVMLNDASMDYVNALIKGMIK